MNINIPKKKVKSGEVQLGEFGSGMSFLSKFQMLNKQNTKRKLIITDPKIETFSVK